MAEEKERTRLFAQDENLRKEAEFILEKSGVGKIILKNGFHPMGSYVMKTMTWRDIDFERYDDDPDIDEHWELGKELGQLEWVWNLHCTNAYEDPRNPDESGFYWGIKVTDPEGGNIWRIDLWTARQEEFEKTSPTRDTWYSKLNDENRFIILSIKNKFKHLPELRRTYFSAHVYEAVLGSGVKNFDEFHGWWNIKYGNFEELTSK